MAVHNKRRASHQFRLPIGRANLSEYHIILSVSQILEQISGVAKHDDKRDRGKS